MNLQRISRFGATTVLAATMSACAAAGGLGSILGSVLGGMGGGGGGGGGSQVSGYVQSVDTRNQQVVVQQSNGQAIGLSYDNSTNVVYNNQNYPVTALQNGDQVTARVQQLQNGAYYTDLIQVNQSARGSTGSGNVQRVEGNVRQVDVRNGSFTVNTNNSGLLTVTMPYAPSGSDANRFQNLRSGDYVRFYGVFLSNTRVELKNFY